ncbi:hypothetical protein Trydic_g23937 [Trypoxylus dichotomus]
MESPVSPIIANIFMEDFETRALDTAKYTLKLWSRYVDNTFIKWTNGGDKLQDFLPHLNSIHPKIKFTTEIRNRNQLPFLDVLVIKKQVGSVGYTAYRKTTHTNHYLNAQSYHHPAQFRGVAKTLVSRSQHIRTESTEIKYILRSNGFTTNTINRAFHAKTKPVVDTITYVT